MSEALSIEYRDVPGWPGYRVGNDGTVWSRRKPGGNGGFYEQWHLLNLKPNKRGYFRVRLKCGRTKKPTRISVHGLILLVFVGPCPSGMQSRHINDIGTDNRLSNLCWGTSRENQRDKIRNGTIIRGENHWKSKLTREDVYAIRENRDGLTTYRLAEIFGVHPSMIGYIIQRKSWAWLPEIPSSSEG